MTNEHDAGQLEMELYDSFIHLYKSKGYGRFLEVYNLAGQHLPTQLRQALFSQVDTLYQNDLRFKKWEEKGKETELRKEGAGVGTVATTGSGGLGFTPTHGGNGGPKDKKKRTTIVELKEFLMLSKAEEHEYPVKEKEDNRISDPPMVVEFPAAVDNTAVEAEQDFVMQVRQIQDHEKKDRRSRESAMSDMVDPMADVSKELKTIMDETYYGVVPLQKIETRSVVLQKADELQKLGQGDALFKAINQTLEARLIDLIVEKEEKLTNEDAV